MSVKKSKKITWWLIIISLLVLTAGIFALSAKSRQQDTGYRKFTNKTYGFSIEYPANWEVKTDTHVFENGDVVAFQIKGPTQKRYTEFIDGARFVVSKPFTINSDLQTWMKDYFNDQATFSKFTLARYPFEKVEDCSNFGCMQYFYTTIDNKVYGVALFAQGTTEEKAALDNTLLYMFQSLTFDKAYNEGVVSKEVAVQKIKDLPEVIDYLKQVPTGLVLVNGEDENNYMVQVYEFKNGHTATFNWYYVDKTSGEIEKQF